MNQSILSKGKDVIEAVDIGLQILRTDRNQVSIEIIQHEKKGFLKIGIQPAIVKITITQSYSAKNSLADTRNFNLIEQAVKELDVKELQGSKKEIAEVPLEPTGICSDPLEGKVWVKNGLITGKISACHYPTITPGMHVEVYKNNERVSGITLVTESDKFEIRTAEEVTKTKWSLSSDSSYLNVTLNVQPGMKKYFKVIDKEPDSNIVVEALEIIEVVNDLEYKEVLVALERLHVIHGFNHSEIMAAIHTEKPGQFVVASGVKPKQGKHGSYELLVSTDKKLGLQERSNGTMDFREVQVIPTVNKGQVIALIHAPVPGIPGSSVSNNPIPPEPAFPLIVQAGNGIILIEDGQKVVATETGRPIVEQRGLLVKFSIVPKLVHYSDVNIITGNIRFKGDVDILGSVEQGMVVEADGNINIFQNANNTTISSKNAIILQRNSIGSTLSAGKHNIFESELVNQLALINDEFTKLLQSVHQLLLLPAFKTTDFQKKGLYPILRLLLEQKFRSILTPVKQFLELCRQGSQVLGIEWLAIAEQLRLSFLSSTTNKYHSMDRLEELGDRIVDIVQKHQNLDEDECFISLSYAINSTIYSGGDVSIVGQGCYNSKIHAGGKIEVMGVLRGGEVFARKGAFIKEAGSQGGTITRIIVPDNQKVMIDLAWEGTIIQIGKVKYAFQTAHKNISAYLDKNGRICF
jgi:uncharacterized protein (DUF342 family)